MRKFFYEFMNLLRENCLKSQGVKQVKYDSCIFAWPRETVNGCCPSQQCRSMHMN
jgi:hypothetical protein